MRAHSLTLKHTLDFLEANPDARFLDLGCFDGDWTRVMAQKVGCSEIHGIEILEGPAAQARARGIVVEKADLNERWPYPDAFFDVVHSSFVIEHMSSIDNFTSELFRVLKPGGYAIATTENGSSWHNIVAAVLGFQTFSSSCCSTKVKGLGNPFALHRGKGESPAPMTHKVIFNYLGFKEIFEAYDFGGIKIRGSGYYPLPAWIGNLDPIHSHFLVLKAQKSAG